MSDHNLSPWRPLSVKIVSWICRCQDRLINIEQFHNQSR